MAAEEVAGALVGLRHRHLGERSVAVDHRSVLTTQGHHVSLRGGHGGRLPVDAGAVVRLGHDLPFRREDLDGVARVLGALGDQQIPVAQRNRHAVVGGLGGMLLHFIRIHLPVVEGGGVQDGNGPAAVGKERRLTLVHDDVPGLGCLDGGSGQGRRLFVVVVVVAVALDHQSAVKNTELIPGADQDVPPVPGRVEPQESFRLGFRQHLAGFRIERHQAAVVGQDGARGQRADLLALRGCFRTAGGRGRGTGGRSSG